jgi:anhydro-N-acetylmuramic acid kinase
MQSDSLYIGLMSGTSLDGTDAVLARRTSSSPAALVAHCHEAFPPALEQMLRDLQDPGPNELDRSARAANLLADHYAELVARLLQQSGTQADAITAIGAHGQTVRHRPELGYTLQLNAPARLAEATCIDVIADFRSADVAAGGQGAPLVPAFHAELFQLSDRARAVLNLGGIANLTDLPARDSVRPVRGWDCGPGNVLLDHWVFEHGQGRFDAKGAWAAQGTVAPDLLGLLLAEPWLSLAPPKSTGRELFNPVWLGDRLRQFGHYRPIDVQSTLSEFTATAVSRSVASEVPELEELIVCGGGAYNLDLLERLRRCLANTLGRSVPVASSASHGIAPEHVEALAFAWLAEERLAERPGNRPTVTGARGLRVLGSHYKSGGDPLGPAALPRERAAAEPAQRVVSDRE